MFAALPRQDQIKLAAFAVGKAFGEKPVNTINAIREVLKGKKAYTGDVEVTSNEWARAANLRNGYWLYAVYGCGTPTPRLVRVRDPFGSLLAKAKGSVLISPSQVIQAGEA